MFVDQHFQVRNREIGSHCEGCDMDADWRNLVEKCSLQNWESVLKVVASNVQDEEEFALLAGVLGQRLENSDDEKLRMGAFVCLLSTGDAEAVTEVWSKVKMNVTENDSDFIEVLLKCVNVLKRAAEVRSKSARSLQPVVYNGVNQQQHWGKNGTAGHCGPVIKREIQHPRDMIPRFARNNFNNQPAVVGHPGFPSNGIPTHMAMACPNTAPVFGAGPSQYSRWQNIYPPPASCGPIAGQPLFTPAIAVQPVRTFTSTPGGITEETTTTAMRRNSSSRRGFLSKLRSPGENDSASETESHSALSPRTPTNETSGINSVDQKERSPRQSPGRTSQDSTKHDEIAERKAKLTHSIWKVIRNYCNKDFRLESELEDNIFAKILARVEYWKDRFELIA